MQAIQVQLGNLPILLSCLSNETIVLQRMEPFKHLVDMGENHYVVFDKDGFAITGAISSGKWDEEYKYGEQIEYKKSDMLLSWLKSFNMQI